MHGGVAALGVLLTTACTAGVSASSETGGYVSSNGAITVVSEAEREPAPDISGPTLAGDEVSLGDFAGKVVVVNTWGSWCTECRAEADDLVAVDEKLGDDVQFLGINIRDNQTSARAYESTYGVEFPSIFDPASTQLLEFPPELAAVAVPVTYVIDPEGRVAARILSNTTASTLTGVIEDVQGPGPGG
ncbi:hypothetical protein BH18ACT8_BH18ACT8_08110 [soil metagenome]